MFMPFGKYRGWALKELPHDYLYWLVCLPDLRNPLRNGVELEWKRRTQQQTNTQTNKRGDAVYVPPRDRELFTEVVEAGYKQTAKRKHPDHGGSTDDMRQLNDLIATLREQLN